jgi:hypothetical protein
VVFITSHTTGPVCNTDWRYSFTNYGTDNQASTSVSPTTRTFIPSTSEPSKRPRLDDPENTDTESESDNEPIPQPQFTPDPLPIPTRTTSISALASPLRLRYPSTVPPSPLVISHPSAHSSSRSYVGPRSFVGSQGTSDSQSGAARPPTVTVALPSSPSLGGAFSQDGEPEEHQMDLDPPTRSASPVGLNCI